MTRRLNRSLKPPLSSAHFRVYVDGRETGVQSIRPLQGALDDPAVDGTVTLRRAVTRCRLLFKGTAR